MKNNRERSYDFYIQRFRDAKIEAEDFLLPLDERTFRRKPSSKVWCIGECFSHLVEAGTQYFKNASKGIEAAKKPGAGSENPMHLRFHMQWFVNYLKPPVTIKSISPGSFKPVEYARVDKDEILNAYLSLQDKYITQLEIAQTNKLDLSSIKVPNPIISFISMTATECIAVTEAHQRRHLEQARNIKQQLEENF